MKKKRLRNTTFHLSHVPFRAPSIRNLYKPCSDEISHDTLLTPLALRINYFDTAPEYGAGLSERRLGDTLRKYPRDHYILSTKVGDILSQLIKVLP